MAYTPINGTEVASGKPGTSTLMNKIKGNFEDHETRLTDLENGIVVDYPPLIMRVNGPYADLTSAQRVGVLKTTESFNLTITGARLLIDKAGTSGTTQVDVLVKKSGVYTSIFTTKPSVTSASGDDAVSTNAVLDPTKVSVTAGDIIRLDITSAQAGTTVANAPQNFILRIDYTKV